VAGAAREPSSLLLANGFESLESSDLLHLFYYKNRLSITLCSWGMKMEMLKPPTLLLYLKDWTAIVFAIGAIITYIVYLLIGIEKAYLSAIIVGLIIFCVLFYRLLDKYTKTWKEGHSLMQKATARLADDNERKSIPNEFQSVSRIIQYALIALVFITIFTVALASRHWLLDKLAFRRPDNIKYTFCDIINPAETKKLFDRMPFLVPLRVRILEEAAGETTGVMYAETERVNHSGPEFIANIKIVQSSCELSIYAFLESPDGRILPLATHYKDGQVSIVVPGITAADKLIYFGRITGKVLPSNLAEELKLSIN
jgi:hypothetical protein